MTDVEITQTRSANGASPTQRDTLRSLKLGRIGKSSTHKDSPQLQGMLRVVEHLVEVGGNDKGSHGGGAATRQPRRQSRGDAG